MVFKKRMLAVARSENGNGFLKEPVSIKVVKSP